MSERIDEDLALQALVMALDWRRPTGELMHHSDRGSQLRFKESLQHLVFKLWIVTLQMLRRGSSTQGLCAVGR